MKALSAALGALFIWASFGLPSAAQDAGSAVSERAERAIIAWESWVETSGIETGEAVLFFEGNPVARKAIGVAPGAAYEMASLSKAVTAACVLDLVEAGALSFDDKVADLLPFDIKNPVLAQATLGDFITHRSGLRSDSTQRRMYFWLGDAETRHTQVARKVLERRHASVRKPGFTYSNDSYAVLGAVLDQVSGRPFLELCAPDGLRASPETGGFASWGGWVAPVEAYAQFAHRVFGSKSPIARNPEAFPMVRIEGGAFYGMGMLGRMRDEGALFWHHGAYCFPLQFDAGSFVLVAGDWTVVAAFDGCISDAQTTDLETAFARAVLK
ncbi:MAG: serine hydrolase domain-containing protein [Pseudomonadota bacterium]